MNWATWIFAVLLLLAGAGSASAQIYKWVDENGNVRFSDKPPPGQAAGSTSTIAVPPSRAARRAQKVIPATENSRLAMLETIRYQIVDSDLDREIGKAYSPSRHSFKNFENISSGDGACTDKHRMMDVSVAEHALRRGKPEYQRAFHRLLAEHGYSVAETRSAVFAAQTAQAPEISIAALIKRAYFVSCALSNHSFNKTDLTIEWQIFDNLARKVLFTVETSGSDDQYQKPPVLRGTIASFENAFRDAATSMLTHPEFSAALAVNEEGIGPQGVSSLPVSFHYGDETQSFVDRTPLLEQGTVTVRTPTGHGSGFFISGDGHILTNEHVVAGAARVVVITSSEETFAKVIRTDPARDIALLKLSKTTNNKPLPVSKHAPRIGEQIYVVGTPLNEELSFSVTRGIVSGKRVMQGKPLIQTDAAVNPGNSGGPVVDEFGNVVAISVSGVFSESGGSLNTNFLIPISDALADIGIDTPAS